MKTKLENIRLLALDVDGILTDGRVYFGAKSEAIKPFNTQDGLGIKLVQTQGIDVAIITGRNSLMVSLRAEQLGIEHVIQGRDDKLAALVELCEQLEIELSEVAYMGDDLPDLPALLAVGAGFTVPNADPWVQERVRSTNRAGGAGAVREVCNHLLEARGAKPHVLLEYGVQP